MGDDIGWYNIGAYNQGTMSKPDLRPRDDPAEQSADGGHNQGGRKRNHERIAQSQPERTIGKQLAIRLQTEIGRRRRERQGVAEKTRPQQHRCRKDRGEGDIERGQGERGNAPRTERKAPLPVALAGHVDGIAMRSCSVPLSAVDGRKITTIEGLAENGVLHKVQQACPA